VQEAQGSLLESLMIQDQKGQNNQAAEVRTRREKGRGNGERCVYRALHYLSQVRQKQQEREARDQQKHMKQSNDNGGEKRAAAGLREARKSLYSKEKELTQRKGWRESNKSQFGVKHAF